MPDNIFNPEILNEQKTSGFYEKFSITVPIRHLVIDNFLDPGFATAIAAHFPAPDKMKTRYNGINEKKSEHSDFTDLDLAFTQLHESLSTAGFVNWLQKATGINNLEVINDRLGYGLHQGANDSFLDIHIDYNLHPIKKKYRKLNFILFFNPQWEAGWGGHLELWDEKVKNCIQSISPIFNRCVIFECSDISYHGYSRITVPEGITRKSFYQYYFVEDKNHVSFHDTIFKPRPEEKLLKKAGTYGKDFIKNNAKKILMKLGWKKFLR